MKKRRSRMALAAAATLLVTTVTTGVSPGLSAQAITFMPQNGKRYERYLGDITGNGSLEIQDLVIMNSYLLQKSEYQHQDINDLADYNADGAVNVFDLCLMKQALLQNKQRKQTYRVDHVGCYDLEGEIVITSTQELEDYLSSAMSSEELATYQERYDSAFFAENVLFLKYVTQYYGANLMYGFVYGFVSTPYYHKNGAWEIRYGNQYGIATGDTEDVVSGALMQVTVPKIQYHNEPVQWQNATPEISVQMDDVTGTDQFLADGSNDTLISSVEELQAYLEPILQPEEVETYLETYPDSFFADSNLVLHQAQLRGGQITRYKAVLMSKETNKENLIILTEHTQQGEKPLQNELMLAEISKSATESVTKVYWDDVGQTEEDDATYITYSSPDGEDAVLIGHYSFLLSGEVYVYRLNANGTKTLIESVGTDDGYQPFEEAGTWSTDEDGNSVYSNGSSYWITYRETEIEVTFQIVDTNPEATKTVLIPLT